MCMNLRDTHASVLFCPTIRFKLSLKYLYLLGFFTILFEMKIQLNFTRIFCFDILLESTKTESQFVVVSEDRESKKVLVTKLSSL